MPVMLAFLFRLFATCPLILLGSLSHAQSWPSPPPVAAASYLVLETTSGQVLAEKAAELPREPASLTKLMTAYVVFDALHQKRLSLSQKLPVPERAWRIEGSRMGLTPGVPVTVEELVIGLIVASGNDAAVTLATAVAGGEGAFVNLMNREAQRLGMKNTVFLNATGLPMQGHVSTAHDLALLALALSRDYPKYMRYFAEKQSSHAGRVIANRNALLFTDPTVDGLKTGQTEAAGWCLMASVNRPPRRLLTVLLGAPSEAARAQETRKLIDWAFSAFEARRFHAAGESADSVRVWKSTIERLPIGFRDDVLALAPTGQLETLSSELNLKTPLIAPIRAGDPVGSLRVKRAGQLLYERDILALEAAPQAGFLTRLWHSFVLFLQGLFK